MLWHRCSDYGLSNFVLPNSSLSCIRPILEYGSSVWDPQSILLQDELEKVQKRAARFVTGNYVDYETGSMTGILKNLKWESLKKRRKDSRLIMLYKGLKGAASIPTNDLVPPIRRTRNHHSLAFQIPMAGTDIYIHVILPPVAKKYRFQSLFAALPFR